MFGKRHELEKTINDLEMEIDRLQARKETEEQELKHMIRMKEEKMELESQKFKIRCEQQKEEAIAAVKNEYRDKLEERLIKETENIRSMYTEILERLPNVNARLSIKDNS